MATNNTSLLTQKDETVNKWAQKNPHGMTNVNSNIYNFDINKEKENYLRYGYNSADDMYNAYNNDLNFVRRIDELDVAKQEQMDAAKKAESQKLQYVDTRRQLMEKYIPETLLAQGVANTGYTADALLKAENNYNQFAHGAMTERANTEQNALKDYQDAYALAQKERDQTAYENFVNANEKQTALYNDAIGYIKDASSEWTMDELKALLTENGANEDTIAKVEKYYDNVKAEEIGTTQNDLVEAYLKDYNAITVKDIKRNVDEGVLTGEQAEKIWNTVGEDFKKTEASFNDDGSNMRGKVGDNFSVTYEGTTYRVQVGEVITSGIIKEYVKHMGWGNKTIFAYNGELYIKDGSKIYRMEKRPWNRENANKGYKELKNAIGI